MILFVIALVCVAFGFGAWLGWHVRDRGAEMDKKLDTTGMIVFMPSVGQYLIKPSPDSIQYLGREGR